MFHPPIILFDLDETLHISEKLLKTPSWNHLFRPWNLIWELDHNSALENLRGIPDEAKPQTGMNPFFYIKHLVDKLCLSLYRFDEFKLREAGFQEENIQDLILLQQFEGEKEKKIEQMVKILEKEWGHFLTERVKKVGIEPVEGAISAVERFHQAGYKIGIVTQVPMAYAEAVVSALGIKDMVDAIVSGEMVEKPKPDPESLIKAVQLIRRPDYLISASKIIIDKPVVIVGDSLPDVEAGQAYGIPTIVLLGEKGDPQTFQELGATMVVRSLNEITPDIFEKEPFLRSYEGGFYEQYSALRREQLF